MGHTKPLLLCWDSFGRITKGFCWGWQSPSRVFSRLTPDLRAEPSPTSPNLHCPWSLTPGHMTRDILNLGGLCLILVSREATKPLSQCFIPLSPTVFLQMLATYSLINCTASMRPTPTPAPQSEAPWEQCLPIGSLSTGGFSRLKCFNNLKYSYQKLNIWKPKYSGINRQLSLHRADLHSPTHFSLLTPQHLKAKDCYPILKCIKYLPKKQTQHLQSSLTRNAPLHAKSKPQAYLAFPPAFP